jgi:hypothetical protein
MHAFLHYPMVIPQEVYVFHTDRCMTYGNVLGVRFWNGIYHVEKNLMSESTGKSAPLLLQAGAHAWEYRSIYSLQDVRTRSRTFGSFAWDAGDGNSGAYSARDRITSYIAENYKFRRERRRYISVFLAIRKALDGRSKLTVQNILHEAITPISCIYLMSYAIQAKHTPGQN